MEEHNTDDDDLSNSDSEDGGSADGDVEDDDEDLERGQRKTRRSMGIFVLDSDTSLDSATNTHSHYHNQRTNNMSKNIREQEEAGGVTAGITIGRRQYKSNRSRRINEFD
jgi:hypothetical protein